MRIVFMGTPEFAVPSLQGLITNHEVIAVVTAPDKPAGRGHRIHCSAVKNFAIEKNLLILQPKNLKNEIFIKKLKKLNADIFIVVAFRMLPEIIWSLPKFGTINLHASLLPKYRGAAPIQRAIMNGETETGLTVFKLQTKIDTGDIIDRSTISIGPDETGGELHDRMMIQGSDLLLRSLERIQLNGMSFIKQDDSQSSEAPKIFHQDCEIHWRQDVNLVYNHARALIPYPCAWFRHLNLTYKIHKCKKILSNPLEVPGHWNINNTGLQIACLNGYLDILEIQPEGKRVMKITDFLNGFKQKN